MDITLRVLNLLLAGRYQLTDHAVESMDEDELTMNDLRSCFATGRLRRSWRRQGKYELHRRSVDGRAVRAVVRLIGPRLVRIITVYAIR